MAAGAIGRVVQTVGLGPHSLRNNPRPDWFYQRRRYGGVLCDIAAHQCDQFLIHRFDASRSGCFPYRQSCQPGDARARGFRRSATARNGGTGYIRVDWYTPKGLGVWGDGRLTILGTEGYIEIRKYVDIGGRIGGDHLFLVDQKGTHYVDCKAEPLPTARR